jgi:homoserine O-succinyltransferase
VPLLLPQEHPARDDVRLALPGQAPLRVGIVNIMPRIEAYEPLLLRRLGASAHVVQPVFVRLETHAYTSSDRSHLDHFYRTFDQVGPLDGLIVTGAPVEEVEFEEVHYWNELGAILREAQRTIRSTLGICWGGLALGSLLEIPKRLFPRKLFGVYDHRVVLDGDELLPRERLAWLRCAHSRHSGSDEQALSRAVAAGRVRVLASSPEAGTTVFSSPDHRFVAHLGHPEYEVDRLVFEWERDQAAGRTDVQRPHQVDLDAPQTTWREDSETFFARWLGLLAK